MKRKYWIGGVLLVMALWGITGCGKAEAPPAGQMVDGPGMMYTPPSKEWRAATRLRAPAYRCLWTASRTSRPTHGCTKPGM